jgi:DNA-binding response OmpR family regulator
LAAVEAVVAGDFDGREDIGRQLSKLGGAPLVALLDKRALEATLSLFSAGFDDVIGKPVHVREILARIHCIAGRRRANAAYEERSELQVFADGRDPVVNGEVLCLPRRERRILECLHQCEGAWITKTQMFNRVYGMFNDQYDESVIESHICRLRRRLKAALSYDPVESQRYLGYRLNFKYACVSGASGASLAQSRFDSFADAVI